MSEHALDSVASGSQSAALTDARTSSSSGFALDIDAQCEDTSSSFRSVVSHLRATKTRQGAGVILETGSIFPIDSYASLKPDAEGALQSAISQAAARSARLEQEVKHLEQEQINTIAECTSALMGIKEEEKILQSQISADNNEYDRLFEEIENLARSVPSMDQSSVNTQTALATEISQLAQAIEQIKSQLKQLQG